MNRNKKDVSIIFVNYNTKELTIDAIKSVIDKTKDLDYEIYVVDNNSQDSSIEAIEKQFPFIKIIKNSVNIGFGAANNLAINQAYGKYVLCLNTDTILVNNAIKIMFDFMENNTNVGVCGANLYDINLKPVTSYANFPNFFNSLSISWILKRILPIFKNHNEVVETKEVDFVIGADLFIRKSVLDCIGLFDENFFMFYEEVDLCKRIKNIGNNIKIINDAKIIHLEGKSTKNFFKNIKMRVKSKYLYAKKYQSTIEIYAMKISYILLHALCYLFTFNKEHIDLLIMHLKG